jgi:hypothetical protein
VQSAPFQGSAVIVKNTFVEIVEGPTQQHDASKRSKSEPNMRWAVDLLNEVRKMDQLDVVDSASTASTCLPESLCSSLPQSPVHEEPDMGGLVARCAFVHAKRDSWQKRSWADEQDEEDDEDFSEEVVHATTMMFRNLPADFTRPRLEALLDSEGFAARYDFIYLPVNLSTGACFGYAFVNLATPKDASMFLRRFQGFERWPVPSDKRAYVHTSEGIQGRVEQSERYRNSAFMHESIDDAFKPAIYENGVRVPFPAPTVALKAPRVRGSGDRKTQTAEQPRPQQAEARPARTCGQEAKQQLARPRVAPRGQPSSAVTSPVVRAFAKFSSWRKHGDGRRD